MKVTRWTQAMTDTKPTQNATSTESIGGQIDMLCDRFESAWRSGERPNIHEYLDSWQEPGRSKVLRELLLLELEYRRRQGDELSQQNYESQFSDHLDVVSDVFDKTPASSSNAETLPQWRSVTHFEPGSLLGDYELLEELGRGGMGVVYRARQTSADRIVALKVIRHEHLEAMSADRRDRIVDRFKTEARAAARLEHDHLVTVFDVGEVDGRHYYSMRFVEGEDLAEIVSKGPLENHRAAGYIESAARAVHEAHQHDILHRDLKPANILIDAKTDRALVTDFGLARLQEGDSEMTRAEDLIGSPSYMSPEQATSAAKVNALTDVYALGATLYHLLTGRPPFQSGTIAQTLDQVRRAEAVSPRDLNPAVDRDLETICLKCLEKEQERRYATSEALADDLQRYLKNESIVARPVGALGRLSRWCRRNPAVAALSFSVAIALIVGTVISTYFAADALKSANEASRREQETRMALKEVKRQKNLANQERDAARLAQSLAEENAQLTLSTLEEVSREIREELTHLPRSHSTRKRLAEVALNGLERIRKRLADHNRADREAFTLLVEIGDMYLSVGTVDTLDGLRGAKSKFDAALVLAENRVKKRPNDALAIRDVSLVHNRLGSFYLKRGETQKALDHFLESLENEKRLAKISPEDASDVKLTVALNSVGEVYQSSGFGSKALEYYEQANKAIRDEVPVYAKQHLAEPGAVEAYVETHRRISQVHLEAGRPDDAGRWLWLSWSTIDTGDKKSAAEFFHSLGEIKLAEGAYDEALINHTRALEFHSSQAKLEPDHVEVQLAYVRSHLSVGKDKWHQGQYVDATDHAWEARSTCDRLSRSQPGRFDVDSELVNAIDLLGRLYLWHGLIEEAISEFEEALRALETIDKQHPDRVEIVVKMAHTRCALANALAVADEPEKAKEELQTGIRAIERLAEKRPNQWQIRLRLVEIYQEAGSINRDAGLKQAAEEQFRNGLKIGQQILGKDKGNPGALSHIAFFHNVLADLKIDHRNPDTSLAIAAESVARIRDIHKTLPKNAHVCRSLVYAYLRYGEAKLTAGHYHEALSTYESGFDIVDKLAKERPKDHAVQSLLSYYHSDIAGVKILFGDTGDALGHLNIAWTTDKEIASERPEDLYAQNDSFDSSMNFGRRQLQFGSKEAALEAFQQAVAVQSNLPPARVTPQRRVELAKAYTELSEAYSSIGDGKQAIENRMAAVAVRESLADEHPNDVNAEELIVAYLALAGEEWDAGNINNTIEICEKAVDFAATAYEDSQPIRTFIQQLKRAATVSPDVLKCPEVIDEFSGIHALCLLETWAELLQTKDDHAAIAKVAEEIRVLVPPLGHDESDVLYSVGRTYALGVNAIDRVQRPAKEELTAKQEYIGASLDAIEEIANCGYTDIAPIRFEPVFKTIRESTRFEQIEKKMQSNIIEQLRSGLQTQVGEG